MTSDLIDASVYGELKEAVGMFNELITAQDTAVASGFRRAAHSIKSNADGFGVTVAAGQARDIELAEMTKDAAVVIALQTTYDQTANALKAMLDD